MKAVTVIKIVFGIVFLVLAGVFVYYLPQASSIFRYATVFIGGICIGMGMADLTWRCSTCKSFVLPTAKFCGKCGKEIE